MRLGARSIPRKGQDLHEGVYYREFQTVKHSGTFLGCCCMPGIIALYNKATMLIYHILFEAHYDAGFHTHLSPLSSYRTENDSDQHFQHRVTSAWNVPSNSLLLYQVRTGVLVCISSAFNSSISYQYVFVRGTYWHRATSISYAPGTTYW